MDKMKENNVVVAENKHISAFAHLLRGTYKISGAKKMVHCYCMLPYFKEAREDFARITEILKKMRLGQCYEIL